MATYEAPYYHFNVKMTCSGCSSAIDRVLSRASGLEKYKVDLESQTVDVKPAAGADGMSFDDVKAKIAKTGKEILSAENVATA